MLDLLKNKKYVLIKNFLSKDELNILQPYCLNKTVTFDPRRDHADQSPLSPSFYNDFIMKTLLSIKKKKVEEITKLNLFETYSFWRGYIHGSTLADHIDRASCEISVTASIDNCGTKWPIHMGGEWVEMEIGDAVVYLGCEITHGRNPFEGMYNAQVFLHYVNANGVFRDYKGDSKK